MQCSQAVWGTASLRKRLIAIQGLGNVGAKLANILFWEGEALFYLKWTNNGLRSTLHSMEQKSFLHPNFVQPM